MSGEASEKERRHEKELHPERGVFIKGGNNLENYLLDDGFMKMATNSKVDWWLTTSGIGV